MIYTIAEVYLRNGRLKVTENITKKLLVGNKSTTKICFNFLKNVLRERKCWRASSEIWRWCQRQVL